MINRFGQNDLELVKYIYNEANEDETIRCELAMLESRALFKHCQSLTDLTKQLDRINHAPSEVCLQNIFDYSRSKAFILSE